MPAGLIDIGLNLGNKRFAKDRDAVVDAALAAGVEAMVLTGTSEAESDLALELARARPGVLYATAGVHPHDAKSCGPDTIAHLRALAAAPEVVAVGECGLDYNRDFSPRPVQDRWFEAQIELACELGLPLFLHERDAHERFCALLEPHRERLPAAVIHCFTGTRAELERYLALDLHVGITGWICDERRGLHLRELVPLIPLERLMLETDAPYLTPRDLRPKPRRNEPRFLPHILRAVATCRGMEPDALAAATTRTARGFFGI